MPVSGAQQAWAHEMLQAAVHSMYSRDGSGATFSGRTTGASSSRSGSLSAQSPQKSDPPALRSRRRADVRSPVQMAETVSVRVSPSTRLAYGSLQPQTMRPSHSRTMMFQGQLQRYRLAR